MGSYCFAHVWRYFIDRNTGRRWRQCSSCPAIEKL